MIVSENGAYIIPPNKTIKSYGPLAFNSFYTMGFDCVPLITMPMLLLEAVHFNDVGLILIYTSFFEIDWVDYPAKIKVTK